MLNLVQYTYEEFKVNIPMPNIQPRHHATLPGSSQKKSPSLIEDLNDGVLQTEIEQMIYDLDPELEREASSPKASQTEMRQ